MAGPVTVHQCTVISHLASVLLNGAHTHTHTHTHTQTHPHTDINGLACRIHGQTEHIHIQTDTDNNGNWHKKHPYRHPDNATHTRLQ